MADLQELFARIKNQSSESQQQQQQQQQISSQPSLWSPPQQSHQQPSVSSPLFSPSIQTPNPVHSSNILSPVNPSSTVGSPAPDANRATNLLNLLRFNGQAGQQPNQSSPMANLQNVTANRHSSMNLPSTQSKDNASPRPLSAADLMQTLQRQSSASTAISPSPITAAGAEKSESHAAPSNNQQDFLLNLLKKPVAQSAGQPTDSKSEHVQKHDPEIDALSQQLGTASVAQSEAAPSQPLGSSETASSPFQAPQPTKASQFTYVNPFEQLHSSSPLNRTPKPEHQAEVALAAQPKKIEILKHSRDVSSPQNGETAAPLAKSRKIETAKSSTVAPSESKSQQSVSEALEDVGEKVDKQVEDALARAMPNSTAKKTTTGDGANDEPRIKKETANDDDVESSWESAEDTNKEDFKVEVYNFPLKPFVSIQVKQMKPARPIRQDHLMKIAKQKKEFDQIDRCLVTASKTHIVYAHLATKKDNGGFRIIRQDSGDHKHVFRSSGERIFNVQICNAGADEHDIETVIGTGVNGSVFFTSLAKSRGEIFADDDVEGQGFIMPPVHTADETSSGSPVKTRAKMSSRHVDYFAVARGKQIFFVAPSVVKSEAYCDSASRKVNSEKYFNEHSLKINTGKAGKDFCFSEDDSTVVSLDKNGRFKFWDIREFTSRIETKPQATHEPLELKEPLMTLNAAASGSKADEKPSVSSIMFLDKDRPYTKGTALRYMLIGFKQNHILQLWDLGLGKPVQEIRLPHEKDSDGICSISYYPKSGIIAFGHPTRNSIYFIHLSAPKYNIPAMEQAKYISMLARNDPSLPKPDSTAIMSGLREFSFANFGLLRSVDMLRTPVDNGSERDSAEETLFELYALLSKEVIAVSIKREDLGWDAQSKVLNPLDALKEGVIEVHDLALPKLTPEQGSSAEMTVKPKANASKKAEAPRTAAPMKIEVKKEPPPSPAPAANGVGRLASPVPQTKSIPTTLTTTTSTNPPLMTPDSYAHAAQRTKSPSKEQVADEAVIASKKSAAPLKPPQAAPAASSSAAADELPALLSKQFDSLYQRIESDKRVQDAAAGAKQDALLRLVSSTLTENVDRTLNNIIATRIEKDVIPALTSVTSKVIDRKIAESLPHQLNTSVSSALKASLSTSLTQALKDKEIHRVISEVTANSVAGKVQQQVSTLLQQSMPGMATQAAQKMIADVEKRFGQQLQQAAVQRLQDNAKIEELSSLVRSLSATIDNLAAGQATFQNEILKIQRETRIQPEALDGTTTAAATRAQEEDSEVAQIMEQLRAGKYEDATIKWISSDRQAEIFDKLFVRVSPDYLNQVSPLVALTVSAAITSSFDTYVTERLEWLSSVLERIDMRDDDIRDVAPKIMDVLNQRLQGAYMEISESKPQDLALRTISELCRKVQEIKRLAQ